MHITFYSNYYFIERGSPRAVEAKVLHCDLEESEFKYQSHYNVHFETNNFGKCINSPYLLSYGLNSISAALP